MSSTICIVGMGYVGLPLAVEFDTAGFEVIGYDIDPAVISQLESGLDHTTDVSDEVIQRSSIAFTTDTSRMRQAEYVLVVVPTPVDDLKKPNLESTVYPGATREVLARTIEETSGLTAGTDFYVGYSPKRMVPDDNQYIIRNVMKNRDHSERNNSSRIGRTAWRDCGCGHL